MFEYPRSDYRDKSIRASRREARLRHNPAYTGKRGNPLPFKWGGRVRVSTDPDYDYQNEVGGFKSIKHYFIGWGSNAKDDGYFSGRYLRRWLRAQVGRPWDDVWSDICQRFDNRSYKGRDIRREVNDHRRRWSNEVETRCYVSVDGQVRNTCDYALVEGLYVHPDTGILCYRQESRPYGKAARRRKRQHFTSEEIGQYKDKLFFIGSYHNNRRLREYTYTLEEVGSKSKRANKNRAKVWFVQWKEVVGTEQVWKPVPVWYTSFYCDEALAYVGYEKRKAQRHWYDKELVDEWGYWETRDVYKEFKRSCNHEQVARLNAFIQRRVA
jgi:hypothetical protein